MNKSSKFTAAATLAALLFISLLTGLVLARQQEVNCTVPGSHPTIQAAVDDANCTTIDVAAGHYVENITINRSVSINGQYPAETILDGGGTGHVIAIGNTNPTPGTSYAMTVTLSHLTIMSGTTGILIQPDAWVSTVVDIQRCHISGNSARGIVNTTTSFTSASLQVSDSVISGNGGGISTLKDRMASADLTVTGSTISGNSAEFGGGIAAASDTTIINSTISGNTATTGGGLFACQSVQMTNVTMSDNSATDGGGMNIAGDDSFPYGCHGHVYAINSLVGNSPSGGDCTLTLDGSFHDLGHNQVEDASCISDATSLSGDPLLGPLRYNGGPTPTQAIVHDSHAVDAGDNGACPAKDQRGVSRPVNGSGLPEPVCDIGAYEYIHFSDRVYLPLVTSSFKGQAGVDICTVLENQVDGQSFSALTVENVNFDSASSPVFWPYCTPGGGGKITAGACEVMFNCTAANVQLPVGLSCGAWPTSGPVTFTVESLDSSVKTWSTLSLSGCE